MNNAKATHFLVTRDRMEGTDAAPTDTPVERIRSMLRAQRLFPLSETTTVTMTSGADAKQAVEQLIANGEATIVKRQDVDELYLSVPTPPA